MSAEFPAPRDPSAFRPTQHFTARFKDNYDEFNRHLDGEVVRKTIEEGRPRPQGDSKWLLHHEIDGVRFRLVVNPTKGTVITGHPVNIDLEEARASGRWSSSQIDDIREFLNAKC